MPIPAGVGNYIGNYIAGVGNVVVRVLSLSVHVTIWVLFYPDSKIRSGDVT